uniref:Aminopeptidase domain-containing protein n=1 Tax=uncultured marine thaumarchaeote KM3_53_H02 TaxID=1456187 RepID=A0A075H664_9ARCH|nr:aminopeptidase domain-containing protein [uncultured marine thaumarchaeote KM3_53_H02]
MNYSEFQKLKKISEIGTEMYDMMVKLYPICRSITGDGVRKTLDIISEQVPLEKHEILTGTEVFDWTIPKEWNIRDAYVKKSNGKKIIDFQKSNLHVLNYSVPVHNTVSLSELKDHLFTLPDQPALIPYRTSYYYENWGFCITHKQFLQLEEDEYEVVIDSTLEDGSLSYGEYFIKGESEDEVLLSCYTCHPSMCNDNLSGVVLLTFLAKHLKNLSLKYSYRFLFIPETIGAIAWMCRNEHNLKKIKHGLVVTCVGDPGILSYKKSRKGNAEIDLTVIDVLKNSGDDYKIVDYKPIGSDERQFCSPGFNLPVGSLQRTIAPDFPEYHTSADNTNFVQPKYLADSFSKYFKVILKLEDNFGKFHSKNYEEELPEIDNKNDQVFLNLNPKCEPKLDKTGIYRKIGGERDNDSLTILWVLNFSDGKHSLRHISLRSGIDFKQIKQTAELLHEKKLLKRIL